MDKEKLGEAICWLEGMRAYLITKNSSREREDFIVQELTKIKEGKYVTEEYMNKVIAGIKKKDNNCAFYNKCQYRFGNESRGPIKKEV